MTNLPLSTAEGTPRTSVVAPEAAAWARLTEALPEAVGVGEPNPRQETLCPPWCSERLDAEAEGRLPRHLVSEWPRAMMHSSRDVVVAPRSFVGVERRDQIARCGIAVRVHAPYARVGSASIDVETRKRGRDENGSPIVQREVVPLMVDEARRLVEVLEAAIRLADPGAWPDGSPATDRPAETGPYRVAPLHLEMTGETLHGVYDANGQHVALYAGREFAEKHAADLNGGGPNA